MADAPATFIEAMKQIGEYLHPDVRYIWRGIGGRTAPPLHSACVVACADKTIAKGISLPDYETRTLAYARLLKGEVRWYGATHGLQKVEELRDIAFFVPIEEANRVLHQNTFQNANEPTQGAYIEHEVHEIEGFRVVDATTTGSRPHDDLIWVGYGGMDGRWVSPSTALQLAAAITKAANLNLSRRGLKVPKS